MVDSRKGGAMTETDGPVETFERQVDRRFDEVTDALVELREYTDLAYSRLDAKLDGVEAKVDRVDVKVDRLDARIGGVDAKLEGLDAKLAGVDAKVDGLDAKLAGVDTKVEKLESKMDMRFGRLDRKLAQFIDTQLQTNRLVERRLSALEPQAPPPGGQL